MVLKSVESQNIEFKSNWRDEYLKAICSFANTDGGKLTIGVDDRGNPVGVRNAGKLMEDIPNKVRNKLGIIPSVEIESIKSKEVINVLINPSSVPISYHGKFYIRSGSTVQELKGKGLTRFLISKSDRDWDEYIEERAAINDISSEAIERFKEIAVKRLPFVKEEKDIVKFLEKLNLLENGKLKRAAILLFGKNPKKFFTGAFIKVGKFLTDTDIVSSNERQIKSLMYVKEKGKITNKEYRKLAELSDEGARKDLVNLVKKGVLKQKGKGRSVHYILRKHGD